MLPWYVFALGAAAFIVVRDLAQKRALKVEHTEEMLVARSIFLVPLLTILLFFTPMTLPVPVLLLLYLASIITTAGYFLLMKGLRHRDVGFSAPLQNISPVFLLIISIVFLSERPTSLQILGILFIVAGTYILEGAQNLGETFKKLHRDPYVWGMIIAALLLSVAQTLDKYFISSGIDPFAFLFWTWLFINTNYWLINISRHRWGDVEHDVVRDWRWLGLSALALFLQLICYYAAVARGPITLVVPIVRLSVFGLVFLGGTLYHERHGDERAIAAAVMLIGTLLVLL